jgi:hypothetical protein
MGPQVRLRESKIVKEELSKPSQLQVSITAAMRQQADFFF